MGALRAIGRFTVEGLIGMQFTVMVPPEAYEAIRSRRSGKLSAAERRAWADLERRLR
jgi:hypothetical protein